MGPGGNRKEEQKLTQEQGQHHHWEGGERKYRTLIRSLKKEEGKRVKNAPAKGEAKWGVFANRFRLVQSHSLRINGFMRRNSYQDILCPDDTGYC